MPPILPAQTCGSHLSCCGPSGYSGASGTLLCGCYAPLHSHSSPRVCVLWCPPAPPVSHCISKTRCTSAPSHPHSAASLLLVRLFLAPRVLAVAPRGAVTPQHHTHRHQPIPFPFHNTPVAPTTPLRSPEVLLQHHTHCVPPLPCGSAAPRRGSHSPAFPLPPYKPAHTHTPPARQHIPPHSPQPPHPSGPAGAPHRRAQRTPPASPRYHLPPTPHPSIIHPLPLPPTPTPSPTPGPHPGASPPPLPFPPPEAQSGRVGRIQTPAPQSAGGGSAALHQPGRLRNGADPDGLGEPRGGRGPLLPPGAQVSRVGGGGAQRAPRREGVGMLPGKFSRGATETGDAHPLGMLRAPPAGGCDA